MVLACSRHMFVRPTLVMDQAEWTAAHVEAFAFFAGVPARLIPDNLKTGVDKLDPVGFTSDAVQAAHDLMPTTRREGRLGQPPLQRHRAIR